MEETEFKGIERLKIMLEEVKDKYLLTPVVEYLITRTDMDERFQNEEKNLKDMEKHVTEKARNHAVNNVAMIADNMVYSWAVLYFTLSNDLLGIKKEELKPATKTNAEKSTVKQTVVSTSDVKEVENAIQKVEKPQISMFEEDV